MFLSLAEAMKLSKNILQASLKNHQAYPFQTAPPFSLCSIPVQLLVQICSSQRAKPLLLLPHTGAKTVARKLHCSNSNCRGISSPHKAKHRNITSSEPQVVDITKTLTCSCQAFSVHKQYTKKHHCLVLKLFLVASFKVLNSSSNPNEF